MALRKIGIRTQFAAGAAMLLSCISAFAEPFGLMWKYTKVPSGSYILGIYNHQRKMEALIRRMAGGESAISNADFDTTSVKFQIRCDTDGLDFNISGNEYVVDEARYKASKIDVFENPLIKPVSVIVNGVSAINISSVMGTIVGRSSRGNKIGMAAQVFSFLDKSGEPRNMETEIHVFTPDGLKVHKYNSSFNADVNRREILNFKAECRNSAERWLD